MLEKELKEPAIQMLSILFETSDEIEFCQARDTLLEIICRKRKCKEFNEVGFISHKEDFACILYSLKLRLESAKKELEAIKYYLNVDSSSTDELPLNLRELNYEEIKANLNPWCSLVILYQNLVDIFKKSIYKD